jgi:hypothetical protein
MRSKLKGEKMFSSIGRGMMGKVAGLNKAYPYIVLYLDAGNADLVWFSILNQQLI